MHAIPFVLKRAYQASLKMIWPIAAAHGLTPARYDVLYVLNVRRQSRTQAALAKRLGVTRPTICKMVRALVKAGILEQSVASNDRRCRRLDLTRYGRRCFSRLTKFVGRRNGRLDKKLGATLFEWNPLRRKRDDFFIGILWRTALLARALGDHAVLYY